MKGGVDNKPKMPPPVPILDKPKTDPFEIDDQLTVNQAAYLQHICDFTDKGIQARPVAVAEAMKIEPCNSQNYYNRLQKYGFIKIEKKSARHAVLIPLKRPDGSAYEKPKKVNGVTICQPRLAQGYSNFDANVK